MNCRECKSKCKLYDEEWIQYLDLYYIDRSAFHLKIRESTACFYEYMYEIIKYISGMTLDEYRLRGISEQIYKDTMSDIDIWAKDYYRKHGRYGIEEFEWIEKSLDLEVFKLGRLQFEECQDIEVKEYVQGSEGPKNLKILSVHIQAGSTLDFEECQKSYQIARDFYFEEGIDKIVFFCDSWLLNTELSKILNTDSNILKFQKQYKIISEDEESRQMEERVFGDVYSDLNMYVAKTSLQKSLKKALVEGHRFGTAKGVLKG